ANFLAAIAILASFAFVYGEVSRPPVIATVQPGSPADKAGLQVGDRIVSINERPVRSFDDVYPVVQDNTGTDIAFKIARDGSEITRSIVPVIVVEKDRFGNSYRIGRIGIAPSREAEIRDVSLPESVVIGVKRMVQILDRMISGIWQVISGHRSPTELGGPIKIAQISGEAAVLGWQQFVYLAALISINLGFINLLPVPMLDGGHLSFYAVEAILRRPVSPRTMEIAFRSGMYALLALMLFVTLNDLASLGLWRLTGLGG
ncbi:MAG: putative protease eep, partial [Pseudomonadota bacterium]